MIGNPLGLMRGVIRLDPYTSAWSDCFEQESERLRSALGQRIGQIEHIGSTAIPGLVAKPILDLMASVADFEGARTLISNLESLGYSYGERDEIPDRHYFALRLPDGNATHHLSLAEPTSQYWTHQLLFRNYLRAHLDALEEYAHLKQELAVCHAGNRLAYVDAKTEFCCRIIGLAKKDRDY